MTQEEYIAKEISIWGEDYVFDLLDRGYVPVELIVNGELRWWWKVEPLTQADFCATLDRSRSVVSPVSTEMLT